MILGFAHLTFHVCQRCFWEVRHFYPMSLFPSSSVQVPPSVAHLYGSRSGEQEIILIGENRDIEIVSFKNSFSGCQSSHRSIAEFQSLVRSEPLSISLNLSATTTLRRRLVPLTGVPAKNPFVIRGLFGKRHLWINDEVTDSDIKNPPDSLGFYVSKAFDFRTTSVHEKIRVQANHFEIGFEEREGINLEFIRKLA